MSPVFVVAVGASLAPSHEAALEDWARARGIVIEAPRPQTAVAGYDAALVSRVEALLEDARVAVGALDAPAALEHIAEADRLLRAHAELPQAGWLLAERYEIEATLREARRETAELAARLRERSRVLEGARAPVSTAAGAAPSPAVTRSAVRRLRVARAAPDDRVEVDGVNVGPDAELAAGEHHVRLLRSGTLLWAGFVELGEGAAVLTLPTPQAPACSAAELSTVRLGAQGLRVPPDIRCETWAAVRPTGPDRIEVAMCSGARCGAFLPWSTGKSELYRGPPQPPPKEGFPAWAGWAVAGGIAIVATGFVLWQSGVFDEPERGGPTWVFGGVREAGLRF